jgi:hypothetical protein
MARPRAHRVFVIFLDESMSVHGGLVHKRQRELICWNSATVQRAESIFCLHVTSFTFRTDEN